MSLASRFVRSGKVRDIYRLGDGRLLLVASDRLSAFDVVLPTPIPDKGKVLTGLSRFWFAETARIIPNHLVGTDPDELPDELRSAVVNPSELARDDDETAAEALRGRMMVCRELDILPVEVIVRGYLAGSGWRSYRDSGELCGLRLPAGLQRGRPAARADPHPLDEGRGGRPRREHHVRRDDRAARRRPAGDGPRRARPRGGSPPLRLRRRGRRAGGHPRRGHEVRVRRRDADRASSPSPTRC